MKGLFTFFFSPLIVFGFLIKVDFQNSLKIEPDSFMNVSIQDELTTEHNEDLFDFWIGNWEVTWSEANNKMGKGINVIEKELDGKIIKENFQITGGKNKGFKGVSVSVLNQQTGIWNQAWVDNAGSYLSFTQDRDEFGNLIFVTNKVEKDSLSIVSRMVFKDVKTNSFTWDWEGSVDGGKTWKLNWRINYSRINNDISNPSLTDFSEMIGTCNCKSKRMGNDGKWLEAIDATWTFKYIMNGKGVQDDFLLANGLSGGSIRQYNEKEKSWYVHYYASDSPSPTLQSWKGKKTEDGNIVLYSPQKSSSGEDGFLKLSFYDISKKGYKWKGEWVNKDESKTNPFWMIECVK
ncbi:hypothetical protein [Pontimicrobium aquaticum]|uniref:Uncharacterized protein n=1 Tax=Pontimicrobium aquaticum TaxID=2565367 RepID=A0A4U0EYI9_9FLAO|nr:hypothetical protein [Pontimicrobium aquaticum]TJY37083.1 hypothetical protein E5167_03815 [Pontimicrobium aquaticum]